MVGHIEGDETGKSGEIQSVHGGFERGITSREISGIAMRLRHINVLRKSIIGSRLGRGIADVRKRPAKVVHIDMRPMRTLRGGRLQPKTVHWLARCSVL